MSRIDFAAVNPHLTLSLEFGVRLQQVGVRRDRSGLVEVEADRQAARALVRSSAAPDVDARPRSWTPTATVGPQLPVRDFIAKYFRGLASTVKRAQICDHLHASRESIETYARAPLRRRHRDGQSDLQLADGDAEGEQAGEARRARRHRRVRMSRTSSAKGRYEKAERIVDDVPYLIEVGFGHNAGRQVRTAYLGLNWSASVGGDPFDQVDGDGLSSILSDLWRRAGRADQPLRSCRQPRSPTLLDQGKSSVKPARRDRRSARRPRQEGDGEMDPAPQGGGTQPGRACSAR